MVKKRVLMIQTGGTVGQERGEDGVFRPSKKEYLDLIDGIHDLAHMSVEAPVNIDSTDMETSDRIKLAEIVHDCHADYDGFVIVHGTDTMVDSVSALNYMLQGLGKPVVFTGAQKTIFEPASDAPNNLYNAVKTATMDFGEYVIAFGDKIVRGNRAIKISEHGLSAFDSPRVMPIGEIGIDIIPEHHRLRRQRGSDPKLFIDFDINVEFYQQSSGTNSNIFLKYVDDPDVHGIVLGAYGAGNIQSRFVSYIKKATENNKPILVATNCQLGAADMGIYAVGSAPLKAGAISAGDMTVEAATQKLMYAIGLANKEGYKNSEKMLDFVRYVIHTPVARDITVIEKRF